MTKTPLVINKIHKSFKKHKVLDGVSLKVKPGTIHGLVGLNGIGKTTLIKIILGLLSEDSGEVSIFGKSNVSLIAKGNIAYLPEKFQPSPFLKGREFLKLSVEQYKKKYNHKLAVELCKTLDLDESALDKRISSYSKGMGQKLGLISIFLFNVKFLILDEPMSGLDPSARIFLKNKLKEYKDGGGTVFFSSHILADIEEIADTIDVLHDGTIHYNGDVNKFVKGSKNLEHAFLKVIG